MEQPLPSQTQRPCAEKVNDSNTGAHARNTRTALSPVHRANDPVEATFKVVELRGLEPLTFSLRRHRVHMVSREHHVINVHVAEAEAPWLQPGGHTWGTRWRLSFRWRPTLTHTVDGHPCTNQSYMSL
jgi:hypothetical protein